MEFFLRNIPFIFDTNLTLQKPERIYFPAIEFSDEFQEDLSVINDVVLNEINQNTSIKNWLEGLGVKEPTDISFIEKTIIGDREFITEENALKVGRYLFNSYKKGLLSEDHFAKLHYTKILTQYNTLKIAKECFISNIYDPLLKLETVSDLDIFISNEYIEKNDLKSEWKAFFLKMGSNEDVDWGTQSIIFDKEDEWKSRFDNKYLEEVYNESKRYSWISWSGWKKDTNAGYSFYIEKIRFKGLPFLIHTFAYEFSKMYFNRILEKEVPELENYIHASGWTGMIHRGLDLDKVKSIEDDIGYMKWAFNNLEIIPVQLGECRRSSEIYNNTIPQINDISGKYLPILDSSLSISESWGELITLKNHLKLDDYLYILSQIWQDDCITKEENKENKDRIILIYNKIAELFPIMHADDKNKLKHWSSSNKLLARNEEFYYPHELSIVIVDGFNANNLIYTNGKTSLDVINLFDFLGVKVIDKIKSKFSNSMVMQEDLRNQLKHVAPLIALVSVGKSNNKKDWENEYERICRKLSYIKFYETTEIILTYGNGEDQQKISAYTEENNFYYVGNWYKPRVLDSLVEPLCKFLNIRYAERILTVLLSDIYSEGLKYLEEKGFDIALIPDTLKESDVSERTPNQIVREYNQSDEDLGRRGEMKVFEELKSIFSKKYNQQTTDTDFGFEINDQVKVVWNNKINNTTANHDFKISDNSSEIYIDSKATVYNKNVEKVALYISGKELELMENSEKYLIARVYDTFSDNPTIEFVKMQLDNVID